MKNDIRNLYVLSQVLVLLICFCLSNYAQAQTRIVVIPFYEENNNISEKILSRHYRRISGFINNHLVSHEFEVINPYAIKWKEKEFNGLLKRSRQDSAFFCKEMCRKYATDIACILWLDLKKTIGPDNFCKVKIILEGQGYDSASRDVGVYLTENIQTIHPDCDEAIITAEKKISIAAGQKLARQLQEKNQFTENTLNVRLEGQISPELAEVFGKILNVTKGVSQAKNYRFRINAISIWRVTVDETELFRLNTNIHHLIKEIVKSNGNFSKNGVQFQYDQKVIQVLQQIQCKDVSSREILYVLGKK